MQMRIFGLVALLLSSAGCLLPVQDRVDGGPPTLPDGTTGQSGVLASVSISGVFEGQTLSVATAISATAVDGKGSVLTNPSFSWKSSDNISLSANLGAQVTITPNGQGSAWVKVVASLNDVEKEQTVNFTIPTPAGPLETIEISGAPASLDVGQQANLQFFGYDSNHQQLFTIESATVSTSDSTVLSAQWAGGSSVLVTALKAGSATVTVNATANGVTKSATSTSIQVNAATPRIVVGQLPGQSSGSNCTNTEANLPLGSTISLTAILAGQTTCAPYAAGTITWSVDDETKLTVNPNSYLATIDAHHAGTTTVRAHADGFDASISVTVSGTQVIMIGNTCAAAPMTIQKSLDDQDTTLKAAMYNGPGDCDTNVSGVTWSTSNGSASVSPMTGATTTLHGVSAGSGNVTATWSTGNASVEYIFTALPAPTFEGNITPTWKTATSYDLSWSAAQSNITDKSITYKLSVTGSPSPQTVKIVGDNDLSTTNTSVTLQVEPANTNYEVKVSACDMMNQCTDRVVTPAQASQGASPSTTPITFVGDDGGFYAVSLTGSTMKFLGLPVSTPSGRFIQAPRFDSTGNYLVSLGRDSTTNMDIALYKGAAGTSTSTIFTSFSSSALNFSPGNCSTPALTAFPLQAVSSGIPQLAVISGVSNTDCGHGTLSVISTMSGQPTAVAVRVSSAAAVGQNQETLAFISRGIIYTIAASEISDPNAPLTTLSTSAFNANGKL